MRTKTIAHLTKLFKGYLSDAPQKERLWYLDKFTAVKEYVILIDLMTEKEIEDLKEELVNENNLKKLDKHGG